MERIDGFLCIDDCDKEIADEEKGHYWVYIDGVEYYYKPTFFSSGLFCSELIAYYGAKLLGLDACFYDLAILNGKEGYISKSLRNDNAKFVLGEEILGDYLVKSMNFIKDMGIDEFDAIIIEDECDIEKLGCFCADYVNNLEIIWQALEYRYGNKIKIEEVMHQFVLMYLFTIIFKDVDKHPGNWGVIETDDGIKLAPLFDSELIFYSEFSDINFFVNFKDFNGSVISSLKVFLEVSASEYFELFVEMFEKVVSNFELILELVEKQIGMSINLMDRDYIMEMFIENMEDLKKVIDSFKSKRNCKILK